MTQQPPRVAGVAGGVGTSTVATALGAIDCGVVRAGCPIDVIVCTDTVVSTGRSHRAIAAVVGRPLLLVVATGSGGTVKAAQSRLNMVRPHVSGVITVPYVARWRAVVDPYREAAGVLVTPGPLAKHLRGFARAVGQARQELLERFRQGPPALPPGPSTTPAPSPAPMAAPPSPPEWVSGQEGRDADAHRP